MTSTAKNNLAQIRAAARAKFAESNGTPKNKTKIKTYAILHEPTARMRAEIEWERSVPRCQTCVYVKSGRTVLTEFSRPVVVNPLCKLGGFYTRETALCNNWQNSSGETLQVDASTKDTPCK